MSPESNPLAWSPDARDMENIRQQQIAQGALRDLHLADENLRKASELRNEAEIAAREAIKTLPGNQRPRLWREIHALSGLGAHRIIPSVEVDFTDID